MIRLTVEGTTLTVTQNGVTRITETDASYADGQPGLYYEWQDGNTTKIDDFAAADLVSASAAVTGTITASITEADIVAGGKTIVLTLTGDTWIPA